MDGLDVVLLVVWTKGTYHLVGVVGIYEQIILPVGVTSKAGIIGRLVAHHVPNKFSHS